MKAFLTLVILVIVLVFAIVVGAQNNQMVTVNYLIARSEMRMANVMAIMLLLGVVLSSLVFTLLWLKLRWRLGRLTRQHKLEQQDKQA